MRYFMHDPSNTLTVVEDMRGWTMNADEDEISLSLFNQLKATGEWDVQEFKSAEKQEAVSIDGNDTFAEFMRDEQAWNMYVTGPAGTGKTTKAADFIRRCCDLPVVVLAFTHKACDILREKLPDNAVVMTLHAFLKKAPTVNVNAVNSQHITSSKVLGKGLDYFKLVIIDEYGMVGEKDLLDLRALQDPNYSGIPIFKTLWLGDPNQLTPVGDVQAVKPEGNYCVFLTEIHRTKNAPLLDLLAKIVSYIDGTAKPKALEPNSHFIRGVDILQADMVLAYTNKRVQELNALKQGYSAPLDGDVVFCSTTHRSYRFSHYKEAVTHVDRPYAGRLELGSKYKTLEYLLTLGYSFCELEDEDGDVILVPYVFGHSDYKLHAEKLKVAAAESNAEIKRLKNTEPTPWAKANPTTALARKRAKAWRDFLTFDECVVCLDFDHARTVHKSQGSTFATVGIDMNDLAICKDAKMYMRLVYVAISRASDKVYTN